MQVPKLLKGGNIWEEHRGVSKGLRRGMLGVQTIAHVGMCYHCGPWLLIISKDKEELSVFE